MKKYKGLSLTMMACVLFFCQGTASFAEEASFVNPIVSMATDVNEGKFTINIVTEAELSVQAFKYVVRYNSDKLKVTEEGMNSYGYYKAFRSETYLGTGGLAVCNSIIEQENSRVIFTGAQANESAAKIPAGLNIAYVNFEVLNEVTDEAAFEELLSGIALYVEHLESGEGNLVSSNPESFAKPAIMKRGSMSYGEKAEKGDINEDGEVDLSDAQMALKAALNILDLDSVQQELADVDSDTEVTLNDANMILKAALNIIQLS